MMHGQKNIKVLNKFQLLLLKGGDTTEISGLYVTVTDAICI